MKYLFFLAILTLFLTTNLAKAQSDAPHLSGRVTISMKDGMIKADLQLSNLPQLDTAYRILLHRGLNISLIRDEIGVLNYVGHFNGKAKGEGMQYQPVRTNKFLALPNKIRLSYVGAYPVYTDTLGAFDYKGVIAFNGKTLRAAEQSKWYPIIYDTRNDTEISKVSYDIKVECADCKTIYINGAEAQSGPVAILSSNTPVDLILFAGDYAKQKFEGSDFLNAVLTDEEAKIFDQEILSIKKFYESILKVPYDQKISFIQHTAVEPYAPQRSWGFVTFPTIAIAGAPFKNEVNLETKKLKHEEKYSFYAHELGHYYFGTKLRPNATLRWFFLESMAEYLSIKAATERYGKDYLIRYLERKKKGIDKMSFKPLSEITNQDQIDQPYRYSYAPIMLLALEKKVGTAKVYKLLQQALKHPGEKTDYAFLKKIVAEAGITAIDWSEFEDVVLKQGSGAKIFDYL